MDDYIYEPLIEEEHMDISKEIALIWDVANSLRGKYTAEKYRDVIIPMVIVKRFECALEKTKDAVVALFKEDPNTPQAILERTAGYQFYNYSEFTLSKLLSSGSHIADDFVSYLDSFSPNVRAIFDGLEFKKQIAYMDKEDCLFNVISHFAGKNIDFNPDTVDNVRMGYIFEDIIRRFSENAEAGDHYTPREVIRLLSNILLAEGSYDVLTKKGKVVTVLDAACGSGGMLSTIKDVLEKKNPDVSVKLFGQEILPDSHAVCLADMLIKGQSVDNIRGRKEANTLMYDCFPNQKMRFVIMNPPFGTPWGGKSVDSKQPPAVKAENALGKRFEAGLPASGDAQLLFMQHALYKLEDNGRAAIITNGSPLFSGGTSSGESQIRKWLLDNDYLEAIIALPTQLFYNTGIAIYVFILSKNKSPKRRGKVQLINAAGEEGDGVFFVNLRKSLGQKRRAIDGESIRRIVKLYTDFEENEFCKIFDNDEFKYREFEVYQPLQRSGCISRESVDALRDSSFVLGLFNEDEYNRLKSLYKLEDKEKKLLLKYEKNKVMLPKIFAALENHISDTVYDDYAVFLKLVKKILNGIDGCSPSFCNSIAMNLSEMDKSAVVLRDKSGVVIDKGTKDVELIPVLQDADEYFAKEVLPHVPDALWFFDEKDSSKTGAEFPFSRYFYTYSAPEPSDKLMAEFLEIEKGLNDKLAELQK